VKSYFVYILSSASGVLYTGVTNNLKKRVMQHKQKLVAGFTKKYNVNRLVCFEIFHDVRAAIAREKQIKSWRREKRVALIESNNPKSVDLYFGLLDSD
jgi:putative endonuclease